MKNCLSFFLGGGGLVYWFVYFWFLCFFLFCAWLFGCFVLLASCLIVRCCCCCLVSCWLFRFLIICLFCCFTVCVWLFDCFLGVVFFPECVAKSSRLTWGSEGRAVFARRCFWVRNRSYDVSMALPLGRAIGGGFSWMCRASVCVAAITLWFGTSCQKGDAFHFAAQTQGFVKVTPLRHSYIGVCRFQAVL